MLSVWLFTVPVAVSGQCSAYFTENTIPTCQYSPATYTALNNPGVTYDWTVYNGTIISGQGTHEVTVSWSTFGFGAGYIELETNYSGCTDTYILNPTIEWLQPQLLGITGDTAICDTSTPLKFWQSDYGVYCPFPTEEHESFFFGASHGSVVTVYDTANCTLTDTFWINWPAGGMGKIILRAKIGGNCWSYDTLHINLPPNPEIFGPLIVCSGDTSVYSSLQNEGKTFHWAVQGGHFISSDSGHSVVVVWDSLGSGSLIFTESNPACSISDTLSVVVGTSLAGLSIGPDTVICPGSGFSLSVPPGYIDYQWNTGATTPSIPVDSSGIYTVEVSTSSGCSFTDTVQVSLIPLSTPVDLGVDTTICLGDTLFLDAGAGLLSYFWNGTGFANGQYFSAIGSSTGGIPVYFQGEDSSGCIQKDTIRVFRTFNGPWNIFDGTHNICPGDTVFPVTTNGISTFSWGNGDTTSYSVPQTSGFLTLAISDTLGCPYNSTGRINFKDLPYVNLGIDTVICDSVGKLTASISPPVFPSQTTFSWSTGGIGLALDNISISAAGTYSVTARTFEGCADSDTVIVLAFNLQPTFPDLGPDTASCFPISLTDTNSVFSWYSWSTGDTTPGITATQTGSYELAVKDTQGCVAKDTVNVSINDFNFSLGADQGICPNGFAYFNPGITPATYLWSTGDTTQVFRAYSAGTYSVTITNSFGCSASDTVETFLKPTPQVNLGPDTIICNGDSVLISAGTGYAAIYWSTGSYPPNTTSIWVKNGGNYSVLVADTGFQCNGRDTVHVTVIPPHGLQLGPDDTLCPGASRILYAPPGFPGYLWNTGDTTHQITISNPGTYSVQLWDSMGCSSDDTIQIVNHVPIQVTLPPDTTICQGSSLLLNVGGGYISYFWSTGAFSQAISVTNPGLYSVSVIDTNGCFSADSILLGNASTTVSLGSDTAICYQDTLLLDAGSGYTGYQWSNATTAQQIQVANQGYYSVTVTDTMGCMAMDTVYVMVNSLPVVNIGPNQGVCDGSPAVFNAGSGFTSYLWSDGNTSTLLSTVNPGPVWVSVSDANGCTDTDSANVIVFPVPIVNIGPDSAVCAGQSVLLNAGAGFSSYQWSTGATSPTLLANAAGNFAVTVTDANSCQNSDNMNLTVFSLPIVNLGPDTAVCTGDSVTLVPNPGYSNYLWSTGDTSPQITVSTAGNYSVTVSDTNSCQQSDAIVVTVNPLPVVNLGADTALCAGSTITLAANPGYSDYLWSTGDTTLQITVFTPGTYSVSVSDGNQCAGADTTIVSLNPLPTPSLGPDTSFIGSILLNPGNFAFFLWNDGSANSTFLADSSGIYWVQVTDSNGCTGSDTVSLTEILPPLANFGFLQNNLTYTFSDSSLNSPDAWQWDFGDGNSSTLMNPIHTYANPGTYQICLAVSNSAGTDSTCRISVLVHDQTDSGKEFILLYPNPVNATLKVRWESFSDVWENATVFDVAGRRVKEIRIPNGCKELEINVSSLAVGQYFLQMEGKKGVKNMPFRVSH